MSEKVHNKLVRDKIPSIIESEGQTPHFRELDDEAYRRELLRKLIEEVDEFVRDGGSLEERADIAEVLLALDRELGFSAEDIEKVRANKQAERGGFSGRIFLEKVVQHDEETNS